jgi:NDP-sugar pyrophosphorylase family protein
VIEAGAVIDATCRLVLGAGCRVRAGAVLRDEVVIGDDCLIGAHCEVARSVLLGPQTNLGHHCYVGDSVIGSHVNVSGNFWVANTMLKPRGSVRMKFAGERFESGRTHFGVLAGNGVRFGGSTTTCPGCIVLPDLQLPPGVVLYGTIDAARRDALMRRFFEMWDSND